MHSPEEQLGRAAQDFVKAIYTLRQNDRPVSTSALAAHLKLSDPAITKMAKRLHGTGIVRHLPRHGVTLTAEGERIAIALSRRHRLIEFFLATHLGYDLASVHPEAEQLEHAGSREFIERLDRFLGHPRLDPHGDPIPTASGEIQEEALTPLGEVALGGRATARRIIAQEAPILRYLSEIGLVPGAVLEVSAVGPLGGPITVRLGDQAHPLDRQMASAILVSL